MINLPFAIFLSVLLAIILLVFRRNETTGKGAPFVPLERHVITKILKLTEVKEGDVFYDLGSGDGRLAIAAALGGAKAYGVEIDKFRVWYSKFWVLLFGLRKKVTIIEKDIFDVDLSKADIVAAYLLQETNNKLQKKLDKELKNGTRILGVAFNFPDWKPEKVDPNGPVYGPLYLYKIKKRKKKK